MSLPIIGQFAPEFSLPDSLGARHSLKDCRGKWVIIYFYPKVLTPGCTTQACMLRDAMEELKAIPCVVFGVSADEPALLHKFIEKERLNFTLLSDKDHKIADAYGAWQEKSMYGKTYMGLARMTVLVDPEGTLKMIWPKVKPDQHVADILMWFKENIV